MLSRKIVESLERLRAANEDEEAVTIESILEENAKKRAEDEMLQAEEEARRKALRERAEANHARKVEAVRAARRETELDRAELVKEVDQAIQEKLRALAAELRSLAAEDEEITAREAATERAAKIIGMTPYTSMNKSLPGVLARSLEDMASTPAALLSFRRYIATRYVTPTAAAK